MFLLKTEKLTKYFGGLAAVDNLDLEVQPSEILGLIGPNGAGKSTAFNLIGGFFQPTSGNIIFRGEDITGLRSDQVAQKGIARTFQASTLFMGSTVLENVCTGFYMHYEQPEWKAFLHMKSAQFEERLIRQKAGEILDFAGLAELKNELAQNLSHGHQKTLGVCIALASNPKMLLLDEPLAGMNPTEKMTMIDKIRQIRSRNLSIILVEHDMKAIMSVCDRIVVLNYGKKIAEGSPKEIRANKEVIEAYLGKARGNTGVN